MAFIDGGGDLGVLADIYNARELLLHKHVAKCEAIMVGVRQEMCALPVSCRRRAAADIVCAVCRLSLARVCTSIGETVDEAQTKWAAMIEAAERNSDDTVCLYSVRPCAGCFCHAC